MFDIKNAPSIEYNDNLSRLMTVIKQITCANLPSEEDLERLLIETTTLDMWYEARKKSVVDEIEATQRILHSLRKILLQAKVKCQSEADESFVCGKKLM